MQTVNFECGHCHNLIGVDTQFLGQQVRCPHCQQVVFAPAPTAAVTSYAPSILEQPDVAQPHDGPESIFSPPDGDDLFGEGPNIEIPDVRDWMQAPTEAISAPVPLIESHLDAPVLDATLTFAAVEQMPVQTEAIQQPATVNEPIAPPPPSNAWSLQATVPVPAPDLPVVAADTVLSRPAYQKGKSGARLTALLVISLVFYSVLATILVIKLYTRPMPPHPLEALPDEGLDRGAKHRKSSALPFDRYSHDAKLPDKLRIALGQPIQLGDLEATPTKVERRRIVFLRPGFRPAEATQDSLILHMHLRNISEDVVFCPTDPFFDRRCPANQLTNRTYTYLEMDGSRFYGGPVNWPNRSHETVAGQVYGKELKPGEEMDTIVCTAPEDNAAAALEKHNGELIWRVQLRRGLVQVGDRELPATAVVGVAFRKRDVQFLAHTKT